MPKTDDLATTGMYILSSIIEKLVVEFKVKIYFFLNPFKNFNLRPDIQKKEKIRENMKNGT